MVPFILFVFFKSVGLRVLHQDLCLERLDFRKLEEVVKVITPCSQQMAANFLLHMVSILRYVSRQQGEINRETVDENSQDLLAITKEIRRHRPQTYVGRKEVNIMDVKTLVSLVISGLPQHRKGIQSAMSSTGELTFKKAIKVRNGIMALIATLSFGQRWELLPLTNGTKDEHSGGERPDIPSHQGGPS